VIHLRCLTSDDWELLRAVRLRALADAPEAFGSTHAREEAFAEDDWRSRLSTSSWFVAMDGERPVGLVCGLPNPQEWFLVAMWVAPEARGKGAAERGASAVALQVNDQNVVARRVYERLGFVATGDPAGLFGGVLGLVSPQPVDRVGA
jgi:GNAT superfamily N-acetyltransferase